MVKYLIGADPEVFVRRKSDGVLVSAHGLIKGDKRAPQKVDKGAVQVDGMALEFNIDPAETVDQFVDNVCSVFSTLEKMVPDHTLDISPAVEFSEEVWKNTPEEALELGCDPDFNANLAGKANPRPKNIGRLRTASGHIHIGWTNGQDIDDPDLREAGMMLARQLDLSLGVMSLAWDQDMKRRQLYGKPGAVRFKPYGVEYRVLSNVWLKSPKLMAYVYDTAMKAIKDLENGVVYQEDFYLKNGREALNYGFSDQCYKNYYNNAVYQLVHKYGYKNPPTV